MMMESALLPTSTFWKSQHYFCKTSFWVVRPVLAVVLGQEPTSLLQKHVLRRQKQYQTGENDSESALQSTKTEFCDLQGTPLPSQNSNSSRRPYRKVRSKSFHQCSRRLGWSCPRNRRHHPMLNTHVSKVIEDPRPMFLYMVR
jgi:hypothetical protein